MSAAAREIAGLRFAVACVGVPMSIGAIRRARSVLRTCPDGWERVDLAALIGLAEYLRTHEQVAA